MSILVAFQGERGAFSEAAAVTFFSESVEPMPCATFDQVFAEVQSGRCDHGIAPIENSLTGSIYRNYDLLLRNELLIVGEVILRITHDLIGHHGVGLANIRRIFSHPQALEQCERSVAALLPGIERVPTYDTAGSVKMLREQNIRDGAAIASRRAADIYGMAVLRESLEDDPQNFTRFLVLGRQEVVPTGPAKTSIVFSLDNVPGALFKSLSVFALRDIDLTKIESRPLQGRPWEYLFYLDFAGSMQEERSRNAVNHLREIATFLRVLGSYPRAQPVGR